jgi:ankyrin repeat protein
MKKGTDLNARDYDQRTAFHFAATFGHYEVVKFFLQNQVKQEFDRFGATPLTDAIRNHQYAIQELFQEFGQELQVNLQE